LQIQKLITMSKIYAVAFITVAAFFSCDNGKDKVVIDQSLVMPAAENKTTTAVPADAALQNTINAQQVAAAPNTAILPATNNINLTTQSTTTAQAPVTVTTPTAPQTVAPGMNPAHGQPGHRCDISVGAPLNSKPAAQNNVPATVSTTPAQAPVNVSTPTAQQTVAPGMNPAHGQPGHRCDIAVGAPLNSKPVAAAPQVTTTPVNFTPAKTDSSKN
jgi:hypothetical protein